MPTIAAFSPKAIGLPIQDCHVEYHRAGGRISRYFDYAEDRWVAIGRGG
jgi:hypothetical protein